MDQQGARIERTEKEWFVVVPQVRGDPLKFLCETEREAKRFLTVFQRPALRLRAV